MRAQVATYLSTSGIRHLCLVTAWIGPSLLVDALRAQEFASPYPDPGAPSADAAAGQPQPIATLRIQPASFPDFLDPGEPSINSGGRIDERLDALDPGEPGMGGDNEDLEERLKAIEERLAKEQKSDEKEAAAKKKSSSDPKPTLKWAGRIHTDYWAFPHTSPGANAFENGDPNESVQDRFLFRRIRLGVSGDIADNMIYRFDIDFNNPESPQIKDAFIGWEELPILQTLLIGNQKRPYGLDHINSSNVNFFMERPDVVEAFNQDSRRYGIQSWAFSDDLRYNWRYGVFMSQDLQNVGSVLTTPVNEDYQAEVAGRFASTWFYDECSDGRSYGHWAIAGAVVSPDGDDPVNNTARFRSRPEARTSARWIDTRPIAGAETYELLGLEGVINLGPFQAVGEYQQVWVQRDGGNPDVSFNGAYGYLSYFLTGEHIPWDRETGQLGRVKPFENFFLVRTCDGDCAAGWGAFEACVRYSYCNLSDEDIRGGRVNDITVGCNWYWNEYAHMQFNYIHGEIDNHFPVAGLTEANYDVVGTRLIMFF